MNVSRQIGWSNESNLLYQILKQLNRLSSIMFGLKPKYKVYTALLTQSGADSPDGVGSGLITIGVTYQITASESTTDFTNVGAPNNEIGTWFIATGDTPNNWLGGTLYYNTGAPVVTVLENTIGNIWFTYNGVGQYFINGGNFFTLGKTIYPNPNGNVNMQTSVGVATSCTYANISDEGETNYLIVSTINVDITNNNATFEDGLLSNTLIEIRVYN